MEDLMKANLSKLDLELSQLYKESSGVALERIQKMSSIIGSILNALPLINGE